MIQRETSASASARNHKPVRTCVGCRRRELAVDLLRVVAADDRATGGAAALTLDVQRKLPGRGAWLHPSAECFHQAVRRRAFARALRISGTPDTAAVAEQLAALGGPDTETGSREQAAQNMSTP